MESAVNSLGNPHKIKTVADDRFRMFFQHIAEAILITNTDGRIIEANPAASGLLGWSCDELVGMHPWDFVTDASRDEILQSILETTHSDPVLVRRTYRTRSGNELRMSLRLSRIYQSTGDLIIASCRELTEQEDLEVRLSERQRHSEELQRLNVELRELNQTLTDSEQRLRLALATGRIGLWVWNSTDISNAGDWSDRLKEIMGLSLDAEVTHDMFLKCVHPDDRDRVNDSVMAALAGKLGGEYDSEYRTVHPVDQSEHWVIAKGQAFFDAEGSPVRFIGTVMDITARKQAELSSARINQELERRIAERTAELSRINLAQEKDIENRKQIEAELQRSERNFAEVQRLTKTGSWILDHQTGETDWSVETCRIFGFPDPPPSPHYREFRERVLPEDRDGVDNGLRESFETGEPRPLKYVFVLPDGTRKNIETISQPVRDDSGNVVRLMGTVMDVTARVRAEDAIRRSEDSMRLAIDTIPGLVWTSLPDGSIDYLNRRWLDFTGFTHEEACGWGWLKAIHPEDSPGLMDYWATILRDQIAGEYEARLRRADGIHRWFLFRGVPLHDDGGGPLKWYGTNTDIDDHKRSEALLAGEKKLLNMIACGDELHRILDAICRLVEEMEEDALTSILLLSADGKSVRHGAAPSLPEAYTSAIDGRLIGPDAASCGTAVYRREAVIVTDIASDPLWSLYRNVALENGLQACWSTPVFSSSQRVLGTFALYAREPGAPTPRQIALIEQFSHLTSIAIEHSQSQETLQRSEAYLAQAQKLSKTGSFGWNPESRALYWSAETFRILDHDPAETPTLKMVTERVHPDDLERVSSIFEKSERENLHIDFDHRLLLPDGSIRHVHVVAIPTGAKSGAREFVGAVMDITEQENAAEMLQASEKFARGQAEALTQALDALARESSTDRLIEHVLKIIVSQLGAHSSSVWLKDEESELVVFESAFESGRLKGKEDTGLASISPSLRVQDVWPWPEVFRTAKSHVLEDIREGPDFPWRAHVVSQGIVTIVIVPMLVASRVAGVIGIRFTHQRSFRPEEIALAEALANQAMLAIQLTRLSQKGRQAAVIEERNRLARDIHDTLAQGFTGVILQLEAAEEALSQNLTDKTVAYIGRAGNLARESLREARRSVSSLRPGALDDRNLCEALPFLMREMTSGTGIKLDFTTDGEWPDVPQDREDNLLRIGQEALTNALRHARASTFTARLACCGQTIRLELRDDGCGFDTAGKHEGFGLQGMRERVESMSGSFFIESTLHGGTSISIVLPLSNPIDSTTV